MSQLSHNSPKKLSDFLVVDPVCFKRLIKSFKALFFDLLAGNSFISLNCTIAVVPKTSSIHLDVLEQFTWEANRIVMAWAVAVITIAPWHTCFRLKVTCITSFNLLTHFVSSNVITQRHIYDILHVHLTYIILYYFALPLQVQNSPVQQVHSAIHCC